MTTNKHSISLISPWEDTESTMNVPYLQNSWRTVGAVNRFVERVEWGFKFCWTQIWEAFSLSVVSKHWILNLRITGENEVYKNSPVRLLQHAIGKVIKKMTQGTQSQCPVTTETCGVGSKVEGRLAREEAFAHLMLTHVDVRQNHHNIAEELSFNLKRY